MFSTPSIRVNNQENADSVMRKPQLASARKAFQDRSVNRKLEPLLKNTPINKPNLNVLCNFRTPEVKPQEKEEAPSWMTAMSVNSPRNDMDMIQFSSKLFKANMFSRPPTPPPSETSDFECEFEMMRLPPASAFNFDNIEMHESERLQTDSMFDGDLDFLLEKPHMNFDY